MKKFLPKSVNNPKGFTLIELLIVIAIIAVLSVIGFAIYSGLGAQAKARNIQRRADLDAISKALEVNFGKVTTGTYAILDNSQFSNGAIPLTGPTGDLYCANTTASTQPGTPTSGAWTTSCPTDPTGYGAVGTNPLAGTKWQVCAWLEAETNPTKTAGPFCKLSAQ